MSVKQREHEGERASGTGASVGAILGDKGVEPGGDPIPEGPLDAAAAQDGDADRRDTEKNQRAEAGERHRLVECIRGVDPTTSGS